jgi:CheY-like chemotaxis protein
VSLPLGPVERSPGRRCVPAIEQAPDELPSLRGVEVLVVDDEPEARQVATAVLQYHGAKVKVAGNAEQAVRQFDASAPDVLLLDIAMPDVDGYTLLRRLRALGPETAPVPAIALTALAREEDRLRSLSSGFQLHLSKPIDSLTLVRAVAGVCRA